MSENRRECAWCGASLYWTSMEWLKRMVPKYGWVCSYDCVERSNRNYATRQGRLFR